MKEDKTKEELRSLIEQGKELGYILTSSLNNVISTYTLADQNYVKQSLEKLQIQIIDSEELYDEYKYLSGEEAIKILQSLSDGSHKAFIKDPKGKK
ncbi:MAG: Uncharacterised protein [Gammaproteobacteria bacterium]|nr:MAG: Uncharacterised protein [Gammaproteobacteria bacterium]|tara:strand:+ start:835 stop:1122 length:288 start_codon:yes stop_codon:yes gene_type:complete